MDKRNVIVLGRLVVLALIIVTAAYMNGPLSAMTAAVTGILCLVLAHKEWCGAMYISGWGGLFHFISLCQWGEYQMGLVWIFIVHPLLLLMLVYDYELEFID